MTVIEKYFEKNPPGDGPVRLDQATVINDPVLFVDNHITILKNNPGNKTMLPIYERLQKFYKITKYQQR